MISRHAQIHVYSFTPYPFATIWATLPELRRVLTNSVTNLAEFASSSSYRSRKSRNAHGQLGKREPLALDHPGNARCHAAGGAVIEFSPKLRTRPWLPDADHAPGKSPLRGSDGREAAVHASRSKSAGAASASLANASSSKWNASRMEKIVRGGSRDRHLHRSRNPYGIERLCQRPQCGHALRERIGEPIILKAPLLVLQPCLAPLREALPPNSWPDILRRRDSALFRVRGLSSDRPWRKNRGRLAAKQVLHLAIKQQAASGHRSCRRGRRCRHRSRRAHRLPSRQRTRRLCLPACFRSPPQAGPQRSARRYLRYRW